MDLDKEYQKIIGKEPKPTREEIDEMLDLLEKARLKREAESKRSIKPK